MVRYAVIALFALVLAAAGIAAGYELLRTKTIAVQVAGTDEKVDQGTTLAEAAEKFGIEPAAGDLLDVQRGVLRSNAFTGRLLVNGHVRPGTTELQENDRIGSVDGTDQVEPSTHFFQPVPGGMPSNPQFSLERTPGRQEFAKGDRSGKVALVRFDPTGPAKMPKAVALTFDDGPSRYTPRVLATLKRLHARATFFVVGNVVERYPELVKRELAAGMGVANHSYSHPYHPPFDEQPHETILSEIDRGSDVLEALGHTPTLFRPPGGSYSPYVEEATGAHGQRIVLWSVDPEDWNAETTTKQITKRVLGAVKPGSIVLLHDGGGDQMRTVKALPAIVRGIRDKGLKLVVIQ
jgi:peptidoglycan/xylan/chitin deacetylase (PgdA/CDA1 family)